MNPPMPVPPLKDRLRQARKAAKLTVTQAGEALGITAGAITQWETGGTVPASTRLDAIARLYGVDLGWLLTGVDMDNSTAAVRIVARQSNGGHTVPVYEWKESACSKPPSRPLAHIATVTRCSPRAFCLAIEDASNTTASGTSYDVGDHVVIDPAVEAIPGDMVLVVVQASEEPLLRRYRPKFPDGATFSPLNADWPAIKLPARADYRLIGPVVEITKVIRRPA